MLETLSRLHQRQTGGIKGKTGQVSWKDGKVVVFLLKIDVDIPQDENDSMTSACIYLSSERECDVADLQSHKVKMLETYEH